MTLKANDCRASRHDSPCAARSVLTNMLISQCRVIWGEDPVSRPPPRRTGHVLARIPKTRKEYRIVIPVTKSLQPRAGCARFRSPRPYGTRKTGRTRSPDCASLHPGLFSFLPSGKRAVAVPSRQGWNHFQQQNHSCNCPAESVPVARRNPFRLPGGSHCRFFAGWATAHRA